jgi:hypothetical protein
VGATSASTVHEGELHARLDKGVNAGGTNIRRWRAVRGSGHTYVAWLVPFIEPCTLALDGSRRDFVAAQEGL